MTLDLNDLCVPTFFILFSTTVSIVLSQSEGDLRLVKTDVIPPSVIFLGRLDIFWKGKWSTVMQNEFGFSLSLQESEVDRDGVGVFVNDSVHGQRSTGWSLSRCILYVYITTTTNWCCYNKGIYHCAAIWHCIKQERYVYTSIPCMMLMGKGWTSFWYRLELLSLGYSDSYKLYCFHQNYHASTTSELVFLFGGGAHDQYSMYTGWGLYTTKGVGLYTTESCN